MFEVIVMLDFIILFFYSGIGQRSKIILYSTALVLKLGSASAAVKLGFLKWRW